MQGLGFGGRGSIILGPVGRLRWFFVGVFLLSACESPAPRVQPEPPPARVSSGPLAYQPDLCESERARLLTRPELPGAPGFEKERAEILGRARATPVYFLRGPVLAPLDVTGEAFRLALEQSEDPAGTIQDALRKWRGDFPARRALFLREGYLYAERPILALRYSQMLRLDHLFREPRVFIQRGSETLVAVRREGRYWFDGGETAREARLLLLDRVFLSGDVPERALHVDLRALSRQLGTSRIQVERVTDEGLVARLQYGATAERLETMAILGPQGDGSARLECEQSVPGAEARLFAARLVAERHRRLIAPVLAAVDHMVELGLPFDEPRTEEGQQDGKLRVGFRDAYVHGHTTYEFNGDKYYVFDGFGRPRLPQVCIDFITDALDWATGGAWAPRGEARVRRKGALHFASFELENPRSVENVAEFASSRPEWFDVIWLEGDERVPLLRRPEFFQNLARTWERYEVGDIVFINGLRSDQKFHFHSFFIVERDPLSGMPTLLGANAGQPQLRTWEGEMSNAPRRYVVARVRLKHALLEWAYRQAQEQPGVPLSLPNIGQTADAASKSDRPGLEGPG